MHCTQLHYTQDHFSLLCIAWQSQSRSCVGSQMSCLFPASLPLIFSLLFCTDSSQTSGSKSDSRTVQMMIPNTINKTCGWLFFVKFEQPLFRIEFRGIRRSFHSAPKCTSYSFCIWLCREMCTAIWADFCECVNRGRWRAYKNGYFL